MKASETGLRQPDVRQEPDKNRGTQRRAKRPEEKKRSALISVIVPVYNGKDYLSRCVDTLRKQTYQHLEILLVDDGSTDGTSALCDTLAGQDPRIKVFHKPNGGTSSARNRGIREAKGEYLGFADSDDYVEPDMYERLINSIMRYGTLAAQIGRNELDKDGNVLPDICIPPQEIGIISAKDFLRELLMHRGDCSFCTKLIRRDCFEGLEFPEGMLNEDFRLLMEMLPQMGPIVSLPGHAYHVCYRPDSNTRKEDKDVFSRVYADCVDNADIVLELIKRGYPDGKGRESGNSGTVPESEWTNQGVQAIVDPEMVKVAFRFGVYQRLEYLLHIPIGQMNRENAKYCQVVSWIRWNLLRGLGNPYLTLKNKVYQLLFAISPRGIRKVHRWLKGL